MSAQAVEERTLETLIGSLAQTFRLLKRATILHSDQLTTERRADPELRNRWFNTADFALYNIEKEGEQEEVYLSLARNENNLIFDNIEEATQQLTRTRNYLVTNLEDIERVTKAESTLRVNLSNLKLQKLNDKVSYFEINTADYNELNPEQRRVAERVYGQGDDFVQNMAMLRKNTKISITETRVYVLNPDYVKRNAPQDGAIARTCELGSFVLDSSFFAGDWGVGGVDAYLSLRGAPIKVAEGDALNLYADPIHAIKVMAQKIATGLSWLVSKYLKNPRNQ